LELVLLQVAQVLQELLSLCEQLVVQLAQQPLVQRQVLQVQQHPSSKYLVELQALELGEFHLEEQPLQWQPADCSGNR